MDGKDIKNVKSGEMVVDRGWRKSPGVGARRTQKAGKWENLGTRQFPLGSRKKQVTDEPRLCRTDGPESCSDPRFGDSCSV